MNHSFNKADAVQYGIPAAILIEHFRFWIEKNRANEKHFMEDRTWSYNSVKAFTELFPYMGIKQIRAALDKLVTEGVLLKRDWNEGKADRTLWYAFRDEVAFVGEQGICLKRASGMPKRGKAYAEKGQASNKPVIDAVIDTERVPRASRISPNWCPSEADVLFCKTERPDLDVKATTEAFRDYWKAAVKGSKLDWSATWRNWVRSERRATKSAPPAKPSRHSGFDSLDYSEGVSDGRIN